MFLGKLNIIYSIFFVFAILCSYGQQLVIEGKVTDRATGEAMYYTDVYIKGTQIGVVTDDTGYYKLILDQYYDSLTVSFLGYETLSKPVAFLPKQVINIELEASSNELFETVIYASRTNIEDFLLKKIQEYKPKNDVRSLNNYQYNSYSKVEIDIKNISDKTQNRKVLQPFSFIFNNIDSTSEEEPFLPVMISETISEIYYSKEQNKLKEKIIASKVSGLEDESFSEFLGSTATQYNIYDNSYNIMNKEFISPIAPNGKLFYDYKVIDTIVLDNAVHYKMQFKPKGESSNTFYGSLVVAENNFAIKSISLNMAKHVNINFIKRIILQQDYEFAANQFWMLAKDYIAVEFAPFEKRPAFIIRRNSVYKDFLLNDNSIETSVKQMKADVVSVDDLAKDNAFWDSTRFVPLSKNESAVYYMIDTIKTLKAYKSISYFGALIFGGYLKAGPVSFGPVFSGVSYNKLEGWRFRAGLATNKKLSDRFILEGYAAYGLRDREWKYGFKGNFLVDKFPRQTLLLSYTKDVSKLRRTIELVSTDNLLSQLILRNRDIRLVLAEEAKVGYNMEWRQGYSAGIILQNRRIQPKLVPFYTSEGVNTAGSNYTLHTSEMILNTRLAFGEKFLYNNAIYRASINGFAIPVLQFEYVLGIKNLLKSDYHYQKITLMFNHLLMIRPIGKMEIKLQGGKVFGNVPFFLSEVHEGNQTYGYSSKAFNLMNDYEFYSDQYFQWILIHHFEGFFFNKIPGIRKLKIREYVDCRGVLGTVNSANRTINQYNEIKEIGTLPYIELGFGLENIVKFFKLGAVCRLTHREANVPKWGFLFGVDFDF
jgi:hypothetical protein